MMLPPDPKSISDEYDSYYEIPHRTLKDFVNTNCRLIAQDLLISDLKLDSGDIQNSHVLTLGQTPNVRCISRPVEYVDDKTITLSSPEDFDDNNWMRIFFQTMFKKDSTFKDDNEFRFVFIIEHPVHKFLSVVERPKRLVLNPMDGLVK